MASPSTAVHLSHLLQPWRTGFVLLHTLRPEATMVTVAAVDAVSWVDEDGDENVSGDDDETALDTSAAEAEEGEDL